MGRYNVVFVSVSIDKINLILYNAMVEKTQHGLMKANKTSGCSACFGTKPTLT